MESKIRVACYVDGFNLYHAINNLGLDHLKWTDLIGLMGAFIQPEKHEIVSVNYYSALATHYPASAARHEVYLSALRHSGVNVVLGEFKNKPRECRRCGTRWMGHEEKQTDTNIALGMVEGAYNNRYDAVFLVTGDSDMTPALALINEMTKSRSIKLIGPPGRRFGKELCKMAHKTAKIKTVHLERNLFPEQVINNEGKIICTRPKRYDPPQ